jgi:hypothetical protein
MDEQRRTVGQVENDTFKSGEMRVVDFQRVVPAFGGSVEVDDVDEVEELEELGVGEVATEVSEGAVDASLEGIEDEVESFLEEAERAGKSNPVLYVPDQYYDNLPEDAESRVDIGAVEGVIPVKFLPMERDLMHMLNRFSFGRGMKQVLEGEDDAALLVNPKGSETYNGEATVQVGESVAEEAYDRIAEAASEGALEYLEGQRGVGVMEMDEAVEIQVDERAIGREFDYSVEDDVIVMEFGDETVELEYDGEVYHGPVDRDEEIHDPRAQDVDIYKFVVEE